MLDPLLLALHVASNLVWIGSILAVGLLLARGPGAVAARGSAAAAVYRTLSVPAFGASFVLGLLQLASRPAYYLKETHFMHAKLTLALVVIALHHVLGARAKRAAASGAEADVGPAGALTAAIGVCALLAVLIVELKPF
jgi:protoporphyrinogen IX oxidase